MADWLSAIAAAAGLLAGLLVGVFTAGRLAQRTQELGAENKRDVNGLGRKFAGMIAYQLRAAAEEAPINKQKLLHLANLIDPK